MPPEFTAWRDWRCGSQRGEIGAWRVAWSRWWRCEFGSMTDGGNVGRSRWWFNLSLWCGLVLVCVGLLGLGWFGLWVDLGMCGGVEAWRWWRFDQRWFFFVWVDWCWLIWCWFFFVWVDQCWLIWCWFFFDFGWRSGGFWWSFDRCFWRSVSNLMAFGFWWWWWWWLGGDGGCGFVRERGSEGVNNKKL